jgi:hypothetical protein
MSLPPRIIWAYTYRLTPPQSAARLRKVKALLVQEHREAVLREGTWEGRMVVDERVAHILVLSDSPDLGRDVNKRLEAEFRAIDSGFAVTVPFAVNGNAPHPGAEAADADGSVVGGPATAAPGSTPAKPAGPKVAAAAAAGPVARKPRTPRKN